MNKKHCPNISKNLISLISTLLIFVLLSFVFGSNSFAATSQTINFQGKIVRNDTGYEGLNVVTGAPACVVAGSSNDTCDFQVKYYDASSGGNLLLTETYSNIEIGEYNGAFNLSLGSDGSPTAGTYSSLEAAIMSEDDMYIELLFAPGGAGSFSETFSRMSVQATAYALRSKYASEADTAFQFDSSANASGYTSASAGMVYYDSDESVLKMYNGSSWVDLTTGSGGSSLFTDGGALTYLTSLTDSLVLGSSSYTAIATSTYDDEYDEYIDANIGGMPPFAFDMGAERLTLSGSQQRSGLTVYSNYASSTDWPLVSFKVENNNAVNTVLELIQDGTGDLLSLMHGSTEVFKVDGNGAVYLHNYTTFTGTTTDRLYNVGGQLYWNGSALGSGSGSSLWTDGGTFSYLTDPADDVVIGGTTAGTAKFFFDVSTGNFGIGTSTPGSKLEIAGASSFISNTTGDLTLSADDTVVIKANDTEADNLMEWQDSSSTVLSLINQNGYATFGSSTSNTGAMLTLGANTSSVAQINLASSSGTDVAAPVSGDLWWNGTNLYFFDGSDNVDLLTGSGGDLYSEVGSVSNGSYLNVNHDDSTYEVLANGWVCVGGSNNAACSGGNWKNINESSVTVGHNLSNQWNDADSVGMIRTDVRLTNVELSPSIDVGTGADGDIIVSSNADINTTNLIPGRNCADGGDAVNYNVVSFNSSGTEATLSSAPNNDSGSECLVAGDEVLIINLQGTPTADSNVGKYETLEVQSVSNTVVTFKTAKINYYGNNSNDDSNLGLLDSTQRVMLQRVPNYHSVTVNDTWSLFPSDWDGTKGGVLFFRANGDVNINGIVHADGKGYRGGISGAGNLAGGTGGEAFCAPNTENASAGGSGGNYGANDGGVGLCGGGGGGGNDDGSLGAGGLGSTNKGGAGGGGGGAEDGTADMEGYAGGGGGGGYGTPGYGGSGNSGSSDAQNGGSNFSGNGSSGSGNSHSYGGQGGGGGSYGDSTLLSKIMFGSGGGAGGDGEANQITHYGSNPGGDGGGVVYIAGNNIVVSGLLHSDGESGGAGSVSAGGSGGGAGGSVKLLGNTVNIGTDKVTVTGGRGGAGGNGNPGDGGAGGAGYMAIYYGEEGSGNTTDPYVDPSLITTFTEAGYYSYGVYNSPVIPTPNAQTYGMIRWDEYLDTYGNISVQTRSGSREARRYGIDFDGDNDYLQSSSNNYDFTSEDFTISMWVKPTGKDSILFGNGLYDNNGYYLQSMANGSLIFVTNQSGAHQGTSTNSSVLVPNEWQHITLVRDGSSATIYRNGIDVTNYHATHIDPATSATDFLVGIYNSSWFFAGGIDEVRVWNDVRTQSEITDNMSIELTGSEDGLIGYWQLNDMTGTIADDLSSSSNDFTLVNASWREFYDWESWKPFDVTANYLNLETADTHTNWAGTNATVSEGDIIRDVDFCEDEDEVTVGNMTKIVSSTEGGYAEATISSLDLADYEYLTAWVRSSQIGNSVRFGFKENVDDIEEYDDITFEVADTWQKVYWDISDIVSSEKNSVTKLRFTNLTSDSNTIYIDNIRAEKLRVDKEGARIVSTPNDYLQYRVIFTTTDLSYQPRLENISFTYNNGYKIVLYDDDNVRLYNYTGATEYLKLDVATTGYSDGGSTSGDGFTDGVAVSNVANGEDAVAFTFNTSETFDHPTSKLLSVMNNSVEKMYLDAQGNLYVSGSVMAGKGLVVGLINNSGGTVATKSLVTLDSSTDNAFTTTNIEKQIGAFGVVQGVDVNNDVDKDGNCDYGDKCLIAFEGLVNVNLDNAATATKGDYVFSSTTAGKGTASVEHDGNGLVGVVASTANSGSGYVGMVFNAQNKVTADIYLNVGFDKNAYRDIYHLLADKYNALSEAERRGLLEEGSSQALMFDNFVDGLKTDSDSSTVGLDYFDNRMGLWGGDTIDSSALDIAGNRYLGSATATLEDSYYYDRTQTGLQGQDSSSDVLSDIGVDPNWYNGVSLQTACKSNCLKNSNLSTDYNGSLFKVTGTYGVSSEHGYVDIKVLSQSPTGITAKISSSDNSCSVASASLTFGQGYSFTAGSCSGSNITITPLRAEYNSGDTFRVASWLLEPETTDDRGSKRVFPEHALILASADASEIYLTIVDADTQRVWMKFASASAGFSSGEMLVDNLTHSLGAVYMMNGMLYVAGNHGQSGGAGSFEIDFVEDGADALYVGGTYEYQGSIGERQDTSTYVLANSSVGLIANSVNDVHANVVPNQVTQEVTVSGWGYFEGLGLVQAGEDFKLPYEFNSNPIVSVTDAGTANVVPVNIGDCDTPDSPYYTITGEDVTTNSALVRASSTDGNVLPVLRYYCYTWEATGTVSPRTYSAWATGGGTTVVNESEMNSEHFYNTAGYLDSDDWEDTKAWLTTTGDLYKVLYDTLDGSANGVYTYYSVNNSDSDDTFMDYDYILDEDDPGGKISFPNATDIQDIYVIEDRSSLDSPNNKVHLGTEIGTYVFEEFRQGDGQTDRGDDNQNGTLKIYTKDYISELMVGDTRGMWPLNYDNTSSDNEDVSGYDNHLTAVNVDSNDAISGVRGKGISLNGTDEYLYRADDSDLEPSTFSVSTWFKTSDANKGIVSKWNQNVSASWYVGVDASGYAEFVTYGGSLIDVLTSKSLINDNQWHQIVVTMSGGTKRIYIDGVLDTEISGVASTGDSSANLCVGCYYNTGTPGKLLNGYVDEIMMTAENLNISQVKEMYDTGRRALDGSHSVGDTYNKLNGSTNDVRSIMVTPDGKYMYVGTEGGGISKIDLRSDTLVDTYTTSTDPLTSTNNIELLSGRNYPIFSGDVGSSGMIMGIDGFGNESTGTYYSNMTKFDQRSNKAYLWMNANIDPDDTSANIDVYVSNDNGSTYVEGNLIKTNTNGKLPEYEYSFDFTTSGDEYKVKFVIDRGVGLNSSIYIKDWALAQMDLSGASGNGVYSQQEDGVVSGDYIEVRHGQGTYNLVANGWVFDDTLNKWLEIQNTDSTITHSLSNQWNDADSVGMIRTTVRFSDVELSPSIDIGTGSDGDIFIDTDTDINVSNITYGRTCVDGGDAVNYNVTSFDVSGTEATLSTIPSTGCLNPGDEVMIINLQGTTTSVANLGNYETLEVQSVDSDTVTFKNSKTKYYGDNSDDDSNIGTLTSTQRVMLQRVPNYYDVTVNSGVTLSASAWDGDKGGVLFFRARGTVSVNGNISTVGKGYRAGGRTTYGIEIGQQGESYNKEFDGTRSTSAILGGGGGGSGAANAQSGGGGGAYVGDGTTGTGATPGQGGVSYDESTTIFSDRLYFGSGGGAGGHDNDVNNGAYGGAGGIGGGIILISSNTLTVNGFVTASGADGENSYKGSAGDNETGAGGGGAGGSIRIEGKNNYLGLNTVLAQGGAGGSTFAAAGPGGEGRIQIFYSEENVMSSTSPTSIPTEVGYNSYGIYNSPVIATPDAKSYGNVFWNQDLDTYGKISVQTRTGSSSDPTDGSWESWRPFTDGSNYIDLVDSDDNSVWSDINSESGEGNVTRDVAYFEDEDEPTPENLTKFTTSTNDGYLEATISSTSLVNYDYVTAWIRSDQVGNTLRLSMGESAGNELYEDITIDTSNTWQKVYWDLSDIASASRDAITKIRLTSLSATGTSVTAYIDNVRAENLLTTNKGSKITSSANDYLQYRVIFTTTDLSYQPKLENISFVYKTGYDIQMVDTNTVRLYNNTGETKKMKLDVILGGAAIDLQSSTNGSVIIAPVLAQVDSGTNSNSIWINKIGTGGNLLRLQTMGSDMFVVDSTGNLSMNGDIEVNGGTLTLGSSGDQGSIRYNATDNVLEFTNDGSNWIALGSNTKLEVLSAEYPGATLAADGTSNVGSMTSDAEGTAANSMNYYEWNSSEVSLNDYDVRIRFTLPSDFDGWGSGGVTLNYATESTSAASNKVDFYIYEETTATVDGSSEDLVSSVAGTWTTSAISGSTLSDCNAAGEVCVLVVRMSSGNDNYVRIGDIEFVYDRKL